MNSSNSRADQSYVPQPPQIESEIVELPIVGNLLATLAGGVKSRCKGPVLLGELSQRYEWSLLAQRNQGSMGRFLHGLKILASGAPIVRSVAQFLVFVPDSQWQSDQMESVVLIWQSGYVRKGADVFAQPPHFHSSEVVCGTSLRDGSELRNDLQRFGVSFSMHPSAMHIWPFKQLKRFHICSEDPHGAHKMKWTWEFLRWIQPGRISYSCVSTGGAT